MSLDNPSRNAARIRRASNLPSGIRLFWSNLREVSNIALILAEELGEFKLRELGQRVAYRVFQFKDQHNMKIGHIQRRFQEFIQAAVALGILHHKGNGTLRYVGTSHLFTKEPIEPVWCFIPKISRIDLPVGFEESLRNEMSAREKLFNRRSFANQLGKHGAMGSTNSDEKKRIAANFQKVRRQVARANRRIKKKKQDIEKLQQQIRRLEQAQNMASRAPVRNEPSAKTDDIHLPPTETDPKVEGSSNQLSLALSTGNYDDKDQQKLQPSDTFGNSKEETNAEMENMFLHDHSPKAVNAFEKAPDDLFMSTDIKLIDNNSTTSAENQLIDYTDAIHSENQLIDDTDAMRGDNKLIDDTGATCGDIQLIDYTDARSGDIQLKDDNSAVHGDNQPIDDSNAMPSTEDFPLSQEPSEDLFPMNPLTDDFPLFPDTTNDDKDILRFLRCSDDE